MVTEKVLSIELFQAVHAGGLRYFSFLNKPGVPPPPPDDRDDLFREVIDWPQAVLAPQRFFDRLAAIHALPTHTERSAAWTDFARERKPMDAEGRKFSFRRRVLLKSRTGESRATYNHRFNCWWNRACSLRMRQLSEGYHRVQQIRTNLVLALALDEYVAEQGHYPDALDDLAPRYVKDVPDDVFSGRPLVYRKHATGYVLYSVGINGRDDRGRTPNDFPKGDDVVVRMNRKPKR